MPQVPGQPRGLCNCFEQQYGTSSGANSNRFNSLPPTSSRVVRSWFDRAWESRNATGEDVFEPFIFAWIAFNGWAMCVTGEDGDRQYLNRLMASGALCERFAKLYDDSSTNTSISAEAFAALWPIFEVKEMRRRGIHRSHEGYRADVVSDYLRQNASRFEPQCWKLHHDRGELVPIDLPHTIAAIYRVRCNLFHGEKIATSEADQIVVRAALHVLVSFMREGGYL